MTECVAPPLMFPRITSTITLLLLHTVIIAIRLAPVATSSSYLVIGVAHVQTGKERVQTGKECTRRRARNARAEGQGTRAGRL